jgi:hypothetical protein
MERVRANPGHAARTESDMTRSESFDPRSLIRGVGALFLAAAIAFSLAAPADAQRRNNDEEQSAEGRVLSTRVGETVLQIQEAMDAENWSRVNQLAGGLLGTEMTAYERSVVLRMRGNAEFQLDNYAGAIRDFAAAIDTGALVNDEIIALRTNLGQLYMVEERYEQGIRQFEMAVEAGAELNAQLSRTLAGAYVQASQEASSEAETMRLIRAGLPYAERFYRLKADKSESEYSLMQFFYQQLDRPQEELRVVRDSLDDYPGSRRGWQNLVALFARLGREEDAFEANKLMYLNGLFEEENELIRLVQYYSFYDNPYRGATILEREMNAGRIETTQRNLETLANMWRQAAEFDRAIPVLERLSQLMADGETALRLAEAHFQLNNPVQAEAALETALNRGGLSNTGAAWELLGNVRFEQVDDVTTDTAKVNEALEAFRQAARFSGSRNSANGWIRFINAQIEGEARRARQREQVLIDECRLTLEAERRILVLTGEVDEEGRVRISEDAFPARCEAYFNRFGEQIREAGMTDAEFEAAQQRRAEQAAQAEG